MIGNTKHVTMWFKSKTVLQQAHICANIMFFMCFEQRSCTLLSFDGQHFTMLSVCIRALLSPPTPTPPLVLEKGMFYLIQDLSVWLDYCEALDVTSLLF